MRVFASALLLAVLSACAMTPPVAPAPAKPISTAQIYTGRWFEIARTPISLTTDCVAGTTDFFNRADGQLIEQDACHKNNDPAGPEKVFTGTVKIVDPGENAKIAVHYTLFGFLPFTQTYWMLDHGADDSWLIVSNPGFTSVDLLTRAPHPSAAETLALKSRIAALGYDTSKLEFPEQSVP